MVCNMRTIGPAVSEKIFEIVDDNGRTTDGRTPEHGYTISSPMRGSRKFSRGGGGRGFQIPRRGLMENFNMAKINNLAIPGGGGGSGPPVPPPLDPPMSPMSLWLR